MQINKQPTRIHKIDTEIVKIQNDDFGTYRLSSSFKDELDCVLLDRKRTYYRLLRQIVSHGQEREELTDTRTVSEIVKAYAMFERGLMYDWCLSGGEYSLVQYAQQMMPLFLDGFRKK